MIELSFFRTIIKLTATSRMRSESESRHIQGEPVFEEQCHEYLEVLYIHTWLLDVAGACRA